MILTEVRRTGYGPRRLSKLLWRKYALGISPNTIEAVRRRHGLSRKRRQDTWNFFRPHFGDGMKGKTPSEVLRERSAGLISSHILRYPVLLLEALLRKVNPKLLTFPFHLKTGTYVFTPYLSDLHILLLTS